MRRILAILASLGLGALSLAQSPSDQILNINRPASIGFVVGRTAYGGLGTPTLVCSANYNDGAFHITSDNVIYQCSDQTGVYQWGIVGGGGGSSNITSLNGQTGPAEVLQSSGGTVSFTYPDATHINLEAAGGGGSLVPSNATFALTGDSVNDDDNKVIGPTAIPISALTCSGIVCTVTNTGSNGFKAGDWVNMRFSTSDFAAGNAHLPSTVAIETGGTVFQVLSTGLSPTQFEFNYTLASPTCASACGNAYLANFYLPFATTSQGALAGKGTTAVKLPNPVNIAGLAANYSAMFHDISPAVTGTPGYLIINGLTNDFAGSGCSTSTITTEEANLQSIWTQAHTDGWTVVMGTMNAMMVDEYGSSCTSFSPLYSSLSQWIYNQGFSATNFASGAYWDRLADVQHAVDDANDPNLVASNGGFGPTGAKLAASTIAEAITTNTSAVHQNRMDYFGFPAANMGGLSGPGGRVFKPYSDSSNSFCFANAALTNFALCIGTKSADNVDMQFNGKASFNFVTNGNSDPGLLISSDNNNHYNSFTAYLDSAFTPNPANAGSLFNYSRSIWGHDLGTTNNAMDFGFQYSVSGSATKNYSMMHITGDTLDILHGCQGGRLAIGVATSASNTPASILGCPGTAMLSVGGGTTPPFKVEPNGDTTVHNLTCTGTGCGGGSGGTVQFGTGAPSVAATDGTFYYDSSTSPYTKYLYYSAAWHATSEGSGITSLLCHDSLGNSVAASCTIPDFSPVVPPTGSNCIEFLTDTGNGTNTSYTIAINGGAAVPVEIPGTTGWTTTLFTGAVPPQVPMRACLATQSGSNKWQLDGNGISNSSGSSGSGGTVTYTASQTASTADAGKLVVMNCASACAYTLPATQPSTTWFAGITSQGTTLATIALGGADTFNGSASVPVLNSFRILWVYANSATATDYKGEAPLVAGANVTFTPSSNGFLLGASSTASTAFSALTSSVNTTAAMQVGSGASIDVTGTGTINATKIGGVTVTGTPSTGYVPTATGTNTATWQAAGGSGGFQYSVLSSPPNVSSFTWVNQGTATATSAGTPNVNFMTIPNAALNWRVLSIAAPATPYRLQTFFSTWQSPASTGSSSDGGIYLYDGTKLLGLEDLFQSGANYQGSLRVERITNVTTDGTTMFTPDVGLAEGGKQGLYLGWCNDGSNLYAQWSMDGVNWISIYSEAVGAFITPTSVGFGGAAAGSGKTQYVSLKGWQVASVASCP